MFSFFKNYPYSVDFFLPIPWVEKLRPEIDKKKINNRSVRKKMIRLLDETFDTKHSLRIFVNYSSKYYISISVSSQKKDSLEKWKKLLKDDNNLYPFWVAFPESFRGRPSWNQGIQEVYAKDAWLPSWLNLNEEEQRRLFKKYNASKDWQESLLEMNEKLKDSHLDKME